MGRTIVTAVRLGFGCILGATLALAVLARAQEEHKENGLHIFKTANCAGGHHWDGNGSSGS